MPNAASDGGRTLSSVSRGLTLAIGALSAAFGIPAFVAPGWAAEHFPWGVTDFQAMTIGAWALGNAYAAWHAARRRNLDDVHPILAYLWSFCALQTVVLVLHLDKLAEGEILAWPYIGMLAAGVAGAVVGIAERIRGGPAGPRADLHGPTVARWARGFTLGFTLFVGLLAVGALRPNAGTGLRVFPEVLTPFTVQAFGAFYLSLVVGALFVVRSGYWERYRAYGSALLPLVVFTTAAAFVYIGVFDLGNHPGQALYIGAYLAVLALTVVGLRTGRRERPVE